MSGLYDPTRSAWPWLLLCVAACLYVAWCNRPAAEAKRMRSAERDVERAVRRAKATIDADLSRSGKAVR